MSAALIGAMAALGAIGGFLAGLLGFGGGVLMFPLLYYVPPLLPVLKMAHGGLVKLVPDQIRHRRRWNRQNRRRQTQKGRGAPEVHFFHRMCSYP